MKTNVHLLGVQLGKLCLVSLSLLVKDMILVAEPVPSLSKPKSPEEKLGAITPIICPILFLLLFWSCDCSLSDSFPNNAAMPWGIIDLMAANLWVMSPALSPQVSTGQ